LSAVRASKTEILLVRHGQTTWNAAGRWQGHADPALSTLGLEQARVVAESLAEEGARGCSRLLASDLLRARATAETIAARLGLRLEIDRRLRELDIGDWSGLTREEIARRDPDELACFESGEPTVRPGGGESRLEIRRRARELAEEWVARHGGERILVVTHLGMIRALLPGTEPGNAEVHRLFAEEVVGRSPERDRDRRNERGAL